MTKKKTYFKLVFAKLFAPITNMKNVLKNIWVKSKSKVLQIDYAQLFNKNGISRAEWERSTAVDPLKVTETRAGPTPWQAQIRPTRGFSASLALRTTPYFYRAIKNAHIGASVNAALGVKIIGPIKGSFD